MIKFLFVGARAPGRTRRGALAHLRGVHGQMVVSPPADAGEMPRRYTQHHVVDGAYPGVDGFAIERDLVTELWFDDLPQLGAATSSTFYRDQLVPDEPNFVNGGTVAKLRVEADTAEPSADGPFKAFLFVNFVPDADRASVLAALAAECEAAGADAIVVNRVLPPPTGRAPWVVNVLEAIHRDRDAVTDLVDRFAVRAAAAGVDAGRSLALATEIFSTDRLRL